MLRAQARIEAKKIVDKKIIYSRAKRPNPNERVMVRDPKNNLILAPDEETLIETLAQRLQRQARAKMH